MLSLYRRASMELQADYHVGLMEHDYNTFRRSPTTLRTAYLHSTTDRPLRKRRPVSNVETEQ